MIFTECPIRKDEVKWIICECEFEFKLIQGCD